MSPSQRRIVDALHIPMEIILKKQPTTSQRRNSGHHRLLWYERACQEQPGEETCHICSGDHARIAIDAAVVQVLYQGLKHYYICVADALSRSSDDPLLPELCCGYSKPGNLRRHFTRVYLANVDMNQLTPYNLIRFAFPRFTCPMEYICKTTRKRYIRSTRLNSDHIDLPAYFRSLLSVKESYHNGNY